jgi:anhydro-N-acetylmuramic acid kinase
MVKRKYSVIGVMSGTSLDGVDLIYASFLLRKNEWYFEILKAETVEYTYQWRQILRGLISYSYKELERVDIKYTQYLSGIIKRFVNDNNIHRIDAVCSHGHTALHQPEKRLTYQIGNLPDLAHFLKKRVVCDFRVQDVELGGQGAPLVPIGDKFLFSEYDFCLNLGGFANISMDFNDERIAYDSCPVNLVLNRYVSELGVNYDDEGKIALKGKVDENLLNELNALGFYGAQHPKSLGLEWVNQTVFPLIDSYGLEIADILRTCVEHMAIQIASETSKKGKANVLVTGGGAYNSFLIKRIRYHSDSKIVLPSKNILEFKEALIFGFLGVLRLRGEVNCLKSVTGASKSHSSGKIFLP